MRVVKARPIHHSAPAQPRGRASFQSASTASSTGCAGRACPGSQKVVK